MSKYDKALSAGYKILRSFGGNDPINRAIRADAERLYESSIILPIGLMTLVTRKIEKGEL